MNPSFEHLTQRLQNPANTASQTAFDVKRMADVERALRTRPQFLPLTHTLPAAIQDAPIEERTEPVRFPTIVHGGITDGEDRNVRLYRDTESRPIVRYGQNSGTRLSLDALFGHSVASGDYHGVRNFPEPFLLDTEDSLTLAVYQETAVADIVSTVLCGERVLSAASSEAMLSQRQREEVRAHIGKRPAPEPRYLSFPVVFGADGLATAETPKADEPLLITGFRSQFTDAVLNFGFDDDHSFAPTRFPIWALCAELENARHLFQRLRTPLFVPKGQQLFFNLKNTIDSVLFALHPVTASATAVGNIEIEARTV